MGCTGSKAAAGAGIDGGIGDGKRKGGSRPVSKAESAQQLKQAERRRGQSLLQNLVHEEYVRAITETYELAGGKQLGKGGFGTVQVVTNRTTGKKYAMKTVDLSRVKDAASFEFFMREVDIMRNLDHPNIVRLQEVYQTPQYLFLVMDLFTGGSLLESYRFRSEADAARITRDIVNGVRYCHQQGIAHRDLKLDNVLLESDAADARIKLVDFGLSAHYQDVLLAHDVVGTWIYMAPEVIGGSHLPDACDMWSIGVIAYLLLSGRPPFEGSTVEELKFQVRHGKYNFSNPAWRNISKRGKNFIKRLLVRNPQERMSAEEAQHHPWLQQIDSTDDESSGGLDQLSEDASQALLDFQSRTLLEKLAMNVVARNLEPEAMKDLQAEFVKADKDGDGALSLEEFKSVLLRTAEHSNMTEEEVQKLFASADVQGQGRIAFNDFLASTLNQRNLDDGRLRLAFDRLDYDHDGVISVEDLSLVTGTTNSAEELRKQILQFDANGDGKIDFDEFRNAMLGNAEELGMLNIATMMSTDFRASIDSLSEEQIREAREYISANPPPSDVDVGSESREADVAQRGLLIMSANRLMKLREGAFSGDQPAAHMLSAIQEASEWTEGVIGEVIKGFDEVFSAVSKGVSKAKMDVKRAFGGGRRNTATSGIPCEITEPAIISDPAKDHADESSRPSSSC
jgi:calcium-dependent protein kinase